MNQETKIKDLIDAAAEQGKRIISRPKLADMSDAEFIAAFKVAELVIERKEQSQKRKMLQQKRG